MLRKTKIKNGYVAGIPAADPRITVYKGIPFAAPPVGPLRWQPPQPAADWDGVLQADRFGPIAMQDTPGLGDPEALYNKEWHVDPDTPMSEDCLYLNVWTPAKAPGEKLPVMLWIFGGGLQVGYPSEMEFDGERIARRGIVFVSINYRLNVFGFFAHPEITGESPEAPSNFGLLDQRAGMEWVKDNIAAFGGDPDNVTIFGQSAGAGSVMAHLTSPLSAGLFHKAIPQSGGGITAGFNQGYPELAQAEKFGEQFFSWCGISSLKEARAIDAKTLWEKGKRFPVPEDRRSNWGMVIDGRFLIQQPAQAILENKRHKVPVMTGNTMDEFPLVPPGSTEQEFEEFAKMQFGEDAGKYLELAEFQKVGLQAAVEKGTYNFFEVGNWVWCHINAQLDTGPLYFYRFNPTIPGDANGSFHSSELWFTFETLAKCWRPFTGQHYDLARLMCNYWTNFAKYGVPNGNDVTGQPMPQWTPFTKDTPYGMYFGDTICMDKNSPSPLTEFLVEHEIKTL